MPTETLDSLYSTLDIYRRSRGQMQRSEDVREHVEVLEYTVESQLHLRQPVYAQGRQHGREEQGTTEETADHSRFIILYDHHLLQCSKKHYTCTSSPAHQDDRSFRPLFFAQDFAFQPELLVLPQTLLYATRKPSHFESCFHFARQKFLGPP